MKKRVVRVEAYDHAQAAGRDIFNLRGPLVVNVVPACLSPDELGLIMAYRASSESDQQAMNRLADVMSRGLHRVFRSDWGGNGR